VGERRNKGSGCGDGIGLSARRRNVVVDVRRGPSRYVLEVEQSKGSRRFREEALCNDKGWPGT
jgi:hypothetical protein